MCATTRRSHSNSLTVVGAALIVVLVAAFAVVSIVSSALGGKPSGIPTAAETSSPRGNGASDSTVIGAPEGRAVRADVTLLGAGRRVDGHSTSGQRGDAPPVVLDHDTNGQGAIDALGGRLPAVAAQNGLTAEELKRRLLADDTLYVGRTGQLLFLERSEPEHRPVVAGASDHDPIVTAQAASTSAQPAGVPLADTFTLHSMPGSNRTIYLDVDGHDAAGTGWDQGGTTIAAPYDTDGKPGSFGDAERRAIQSIWVRMAEDFAPLDVDVTTEEPPLDAIRRSGSSDQRFGARLVITPTPIYPCGCGGIAFVGVFDAPQHHDYYQPAFVFTGGVGTGAKNIAEAGSHEIGHTLGLSHDGTQSGSYYSGHGDWAPIMGAGYSKSITQWSRGEYDGANQREDDFSVMARHGLMPRIDDHADTATGATAISGPTLAASGIIGVGGDLDAFRFAAGKGRLHLEVGPSATSPNLYVLFRLDKADGTVLAYRVSSPEGATGGDGSRAIPATVDLDVEAGEYVLYVVGIKFGSAASTGYSRYGSVGAYTVSGSVPARANEPVREGEPQGEPAPESAPDREPETQSEPDPPPPSGPTGTAADDALALLNSLANS